MTIQGQSDVAMKEAMEATRTVMRTRHHLHPAQHDDFALETSDSALEFWNKLQRYLVFAGIALPTVGLVVGAIEHDVDDDDCAADERHGRERGSSDRLVGDDAVQ